MRLIVRTTLAAALLAACHPAPPALAPSPGAAGLEQRGPSAASSSLTLHPTIANDDARRLASAHASLAAGTQRAHGTRTALIVAAIAAAAVVVILIAGGGSGSAY